MNVYKYIYVKFYELRRKIVGYSPAEAYVCLLFIAIVDCWLFFGLVYLFDGCIGYVLVSQYPLVFTIILIGGALLISWLRQIYMYKKEMIWIKINDGKSKPRSLYVNKNFERIKKEVADEPRKVFWGVFSLLYVLFAFSFWALSTYLWAIKIISSPFKIPD